MCYCTPQACHTEIIRRTILAMLRKPTDHCFEQHIGCTEYLCGVCVYGEKRCTVCHGGIEGTLMPQCPNQRLTDQQMLAIRRGELLYADQAWIGGKEAVDTYRRFMHLWIDLVIPHSFNLPFAASSQAGARRDAAGDLLRSGRLEIAPEAISRWATFVDHRTRGLSTYVGD